jgi:hypothetical protein
MTRLYTYVLFVLFMHTQRRIQYFSSGVAYIMHVVAYILYVEAFVGICGPSGRRSRDFQYTKEYTAAIVCPYVQAQTRV